MENNREQAINVNIANYEGKEPIEVVIRNGEAAKPLETKAPVAIRFEGTLGSVSEWLSKRVNTIDQVKAHVEVDRDENTITLVYNETDPYNLSMVKGAIAFTEEYLSLGINSDVQWEPNKLGRFFKLNRAMFADKSENMVLVSKLLNFTAKTSTEIEKSKDPSGARADVFRQTVDSDLKSFQVAIAIVKGQPKQNVLVEFDHTIVDRICMLQLVSPDCKDAVAEYTERCIDEEIAKIKELAPGLAIMEK